MLDAWPFYLAAVPAVLIFGISKGGFGGGVGFAAVPLMALVISPAKAAAVLLPLLCFMDLIGIRAYRHHWDGRIMRSMLPGSLLGIAIGSFAFGWLSDDLVRVVLGIIAVLFAADWFLRSGDERPPRRHAPLAAGGWGVACGFTSTIAHAGGPPANFYLLPLRLDKTVFVGTTVMLFWIVNATKLVPYTALGLFSRETLLLSAVLAPVAAIGMLAGIKLHGRVNERLFYIICYVFVFLTGLRLIYDGLT